MSGDDGVLVIDAKQPGFSLGNRHFPKGRDEATLVFEARSPTETTIAFASPRPRGKLKPITLTKAWKTYRLSAKEAALIRNRFSLRMTEVGRAEIRNAHVVSADGTVMMRYRFY